MNVLLRGGLLLLLAVCGFVGGGLVGARFVAQGSGFAGGATVFWWAIGGVVAAIAAGVLAVKRLSNRALQLTFVAVVILTGLVVAWVGSRLGGRASSGMRGVVTLHAASGAQTTPGLAADLPIGLGIARVRVSPGGVLHFYGQPVELSGDENPVRARPLDDSPVLATTTGALAPLAIQGDWMKVSISHLADRMPPEGWIRWRRGDRLLVTYNPLS